MSEQFAVIGTPVSHSLSPAIHNAIFAAEGRDATMVAIDPQTHEVLERDLGQWAEDGTYQGLAVTAPYKPVAAALKGQRSAVVEALGAANTLTWADDGTWRIENTDVAGFIAAIQLLRAPIAYRTFVVFGTGAVARSIVYALIGQNAAAVHVVGRSLEKARACIDFSALDDPQFQAALTAGTTDLVAATAPAGKRFDCAINATTLGLSSSDALVFPLAWFEEYAATIFDVVYRPHATTRLVAEARNRGIPALDGRMMLAAQAAEQARIWGATLPHEELLEIARSATEE